MIYQPPLTPPNSSDNNIDRCPREIDPKSSGHTRPPFTLDLSITFLYDLFSYIRVCGFYPFALSKPLMEGYME